MRHRSSRESGERRRLLSSRQSMRCRSRAVPRDVEHRVHLLKSTPATLTKKQRWMPGRRVQRGTSALHPGGCPALIPNSISLSGASMTITTPDWVKDASSIRFSRSICQERSRCQTASASGRLGFSAHILWLQGRRSRWAWPSSLDYSARPGHQRHLLQSRSLHRRPIIAITPTTISTSIRSSAATPRSRAPARRSARARHPRHPGRRVQSCQPRLLAISSHPGKRRQRRRTSIGSISVRIA